MAIFLNFSFLRNIGQENILNDIPERENAFLGYKNNKFKWAFFERFLSGNRGQENILNDILEQKKRLSRL